MGRLTTHVLNTAEGLPAAAMGYALYRLEEGQAPRLLCQGATNEDGRAPAPLLEGASFLAGVYELVFEAGAYFAHRGQALAQPAFVGQVVLRFGIADATQHFHVPLLVSPWSWSTYRGS